MARDGWSIQRRIQNRQPLPDWYLNQPPSHPLDAFYLNAFDDLSTERQFGVNGMGPIPASRINEFAARWKLDAGMTEVFKRVIRLMDEAYLSWTMEKRRKTEETQPDGKRQ